MRKIRYQMLMTFAVSTIAMNAQTTAPLLDNNAVDGTYKGLTERVNLGVTLGTTGVGFDVSVPIIDQLRLRSGFSFVPRFDVSMTFGIQVGDDPATSERKFNRMSTMLESLTGNHVVNYVLITGTAKMWNWNVMADVYPLKNNKHWRVTAGCFIGPTTAADAVNKTESMPSLMGVDIYNNMYNKLHGVSRKDLPEVKLIDFGEGYEGVFTDPELLLKLQKRLDNAGRMGIHLGTYSHDIVDENGQVIHHQGDEYVMEPNNEHMVTTEMKVNAVKPYLGFGYDGRLVKENDKLHVSVDAGVMFWGGTPKLITHDGTDLINDVEGIKGKIGKYVDFISKFPVFPMVNVRFSYTL